MKRWISQDIIVILLINVTYVLSDEFLRMCYFPSWASTRTNVAKFDVENVNVTLCTHLIYAYGKFDGGTKRLMGFGIDDVPGSRFSEINNIKRCHPAIKTLLSVKADSGLFPINSSDDTIAISSKEAIKFLRTQGFDGIVIEWWDPYYRLDAKVPSIVQTFRAAVENDTISPKLLLAISSPAGATLINLSAAIDVKKTARYVDYFLMKPNDSLGKIVSNAQFTSPLFQPTQVLNSTSTNWTVFRWNDLGIPSSKIVIGVTGAGVRRVLKHMNQVTPGSPVTGEIRRGKYYNLEAVLAYPEICKILSLPSTKKYVDEYQKNPYLVNGDEWIGYEDKTSLKIKIRWMQDVKAAGVLFSSLDLDDFTGQFCNQGKYPLLNTIYSVVMEARNETYAAAGTATQITATLTTVKACDAIFLPFICTILQVYLIA